MRFIRGLIDRLLLLATAIMGGLVPGFISQYRQRLGGRLDQAGIDLPAMGYSIIQRQVTDAATHVILARGTK